MLDYLLLASCLAALAMSAVVLHKVRRIHQTSYAIAEDAAAARREAEALYGQWQATELLRHALELSAPMPAMRGWAGSPDFLLHVARAVRQRRPRAMLECSSGVSTLVAARCLQLNGQGHVWSLEHDAHYAERTRELLREHGLQDWATVLVAPLTSRDGEAPWYDERALPAELAEVGLLVVDGPPESTAPMARAPALARLRTRLARGAEIYLDDAGRDAERATVAAWLANDPTLKTRSLPAEKGLVVVTLPS
ncbi:MAG: class I SAM-dependent methyltransferase [Hydrogenophaga sp.]|jgi:hypothetical protein|nr:class I SAM-dependent methyltransferase [Hydrogenophaga sp.]